MIPVADHGFLTKPKQGIVSRGRRKRVEPPGLFPVDSSDSQEVLIAAGPKLPDLLKERTAHWQQVSSTATIVSKDPFYHPPALPILSKSPLIVHSEPCSAHSPQHARVRLHSILNGTVPPRPIPLPVDPDTTPSPFLLSSSTFEVAVDQDSLAGDVSDDDETPTTSPVKETGENWIR